MNINRQCRLSEDGYNDSISKGFTIVELLVVIVVIGILAAITIVSYSNVQNQAKKSRINSDLTQAYKKLETFKISESTDEKYPADINSLNLNISNSLLYDYNPSSNNDNYCLAIHDGDFVYSITNIDDIIRSIDCDENGIIGWWTMNNESIDRSGLGHDINIVGTISVDGQNGQLNGANYYNGSSSDYSTVNNYDFGVMRSNAMDGDWSLSIWAKWDSIYRSEAVLIGRSGCHGGIYTYNNKYVFSIKTSSCWTGAQTIFGSDLDNNWHLLTATYEGGEMNFYDNAVHMGSATLNDMLNYSTTLYLGLSSSSFTWNGSLDDARVYNRALSASEVQLIFNKGAK